MTEIRICGIDAALNHTGIVLLVDGKLKDYAFYTTNVAASKTSKKGARLILHNAKPVDHQMKQMSRLAWIDQWFEEVLERMHPTHVFLEDYALGTSRGGHFSGELGGLIRLRCFRAGWKLRLHDPLSLKMFTCHNGHAEKEDMEKAVKERWKINFSKLNPQPKPGKDQNTEVSEDMNDAFSLAKIGETELKLRSGEILLKDLHPKEIQVFNRVTKMYSISLLGREFIYLR